MHRRVAPPAPSSCASCTPCRYRRRDSARTGGATRLRTVSGGGGVEAEGGGGGEVEALGAAVDRDADAVVGQGRDLGWEAPGLVAEQPGRTPPQQVAGVVQGGLAVTVGGEHGQSGRAGGGHGGRDVRLDDDRQVEQAADAGPDGLGVVGVDGRTRQHDAVGAGGVGRPDHGAGVAGVADVGADGDEAGAFDQRRQRDVEEAADRDHAGRGDRVGQGREGAVVDDGPRRGGVAPRGVPLGRLDRREHLDDAAVDGQGGLDGLRTVGKEEPPLGTYRAAAELPGLLDAGVARRQGDDGSRQAETLSSRGALTSSGRAALAVSTSTAKAGASLTARSARILRSTSTPARCRPWMKRL